MRRALVGALAALGACAALGAAPGPLAPSRAAAGASLRIVSLTPSLTDTVVALGAARALVGVTRFDEIPALAEVPRVGGYADFSLERVISLRPDLVLAQRHAANERALDALAARGIHVATFELSSVDDVLSALGEVARILGRPGEGEALAQSIGEARQRWRRRGEALGVGRPPRVLVALGFSPLVVASPKSFIGELLGDCGASNVVPPSRAAYPVFSLERLAASPVDVIVDAADVGDSSAALRRLDVLSRSRWVRWPRPALLRPGPSIPAALDSLCGAVHARIAQAHAPPGP